MKIRIGTRGSELALRQAHYAAERIGADTDIIVIKTGGDRVQNVSFDKMEGKGFFTKEIEEALLAEEIDLAVHSLKDLPTENPAGLALVAVPERENTADLLLIEKGAADTSLPLHLKKGASVGTSAVRRRAQISCVRPDITIKPIRGNVSTRLRRLKEGFCDAIVLAAAGLARLSADTGDFYIRDLSLDGFLPAPGQGALALQAREDDEAVKMCTAPLNDLASFRQVTAERAFLQEFGGGCHIPLGALAKTIGSDIVLEGLVAAPDGSAFYRDSLTGKDPIETGRSLAEILKAKGAEKVL